MMYCSVNFTHTHTHAPHTPHTHAHSAYVIHCFSTATMVTRTCLSFTLYSYVHCLSVYSVAHSHLAVVEGVAAFSVLYFGITVVFDVTHIARSVQSHSVAARNGHVLCPS